MLRLMSPADEGADVAVDEVRPERTESDETLLGMFVSSRDRDAFTAIVRRYERLVMGVALRQVRDRHRAEDVFQATFVVLAEQAERIRRPESLASWLHGTARRIGLRVVQDSRRESTAITDGPPVNVAEPSALEKLQQEIELQTFDTELAALPERFRLPLVLHYLEGLTAREVAHRLGLTTATIESRLKRGRWELRKRLLRQGIGFGVVMTSIPLFQQTAMAGSLVDLTATTSLAWVTQQPLDACTATAAQLAGKELTAMTTIKSTTLVTAAAVLCLGGGILGHGLAGGLSSGSGETVARSAIVGPEAPNGIPSTTGDAAAAFVLADAGGEANPKKPAAAAAADQPRPLKPEPVLAIRIETDGRLSIDGENSRITADALQLRLNSVKPHAVSLTIAPEASYRAVGTVVELIEKSGVQSIQMSEAVTVNGTDSPATESSSIDKRPQEPPSSRSFRNLSESRQRIEDTLALKASFEFTDDLMLEGFVHYLNSEFGIPARLDLSTLNDDARRKAPLSGLQGEFSVSDALDLLLENVDGDSLDYIIHNGMLTITTRDKAASHMETVIYDLRHLPEVQELGDEGFDFVVEYLQYGTSGTWSRPNVAFGFGGAEGIIGPEVPKPGEGSITRLPGGLAIRQTQRVHREIEALLQQLDQFVEAGGGIPPQSATSGYGSGMELGADALAPANAR